MTLRSFARHKLYSFINIIGLAVALTCAILILLFVRDQLSYDAWIPGTKGLYRLEVTFHIPGQVACLGLFGLVVFTAERSTKEIGIRKVSGARTFDVVRLMLWRISAPVLVANLVAWPIAYAYLRHWLEGYVYRVPLSPIYFLAAGGVALLIAWATVYANTLMLARTNPVHALRYE